MSELLHDTLRETSPLVGNGHQPDSWTPLDLSRLPERPAIQPTLGNVGLVYPGKRHVFSGPPESAKTIAAYAILISVIRHGHHGLLIDFEMGSYDARDRLVELGATSEELARVAYIEPDEPATAERIAQLVARQPALVVVDAAAGAYDIQGLDDNKRADVERISRLYVRAFWKAGIATIFIDHVVKNTETRGRFVIGSERKLGGADVHLGFDIIEPVSRGSNGRYKIVTHKDRGGWLKRGHIADLDLASDPDTHSLAWTFRQTADTSVGDGGYFRPTGLMEKLSIYLEMQSEPVTRNTICDAIGRRRKYVLAAITALEAEGFVTETTGPHAATLVRSLRPYREKDEDHDSENPWKTGVGTSSRLPKEATDGPNATPDDDPNTKPLQIAGIDVTDSRLVPGSRLVPVQFPEPDISTGSRGSPPYRGTTEGTRDPEPDEAPVWFPDTDQDDDIPFT